jgi:hypothetical protein
LIIRPPRLPPSGPRKLSSKRNAVPPPASPVTPGEAIFPAIQPRDQRLKDALALIDVRVLDHHIIGDGGGTSLAERGLL